MSDKIDALAKSRKDGYVEISPIYPKRTDDGNVQIKVYTNMGWLWAFMFGFGALFGLAAALALKALA